jgi:cysteinyl-tRNA synthetase
MCTALGLELGSGQRVNDDEFASAREKAAALDAARAAKDFTRADALRAELQAAGWLVETTKQGTTLRRT